MCENRRGKVSWNEARRGGIFQLYGQERCVKIGGVKVSWNEVKRDGVF